MIIKKIRPIGLFSKAFNIRNCLAQ